MTEMSTSIHAENKAQPTGGPTETHTPTPADSTSHSPNEHLAGPTRRKSIIERIREGRAERKASHDNLRDNGPYKFVPDPHHPGKEVLQKNPHWPYEDSWTRENAGLTVRPEDEGKPDSVKQQLGHWGQTADASGQDYINGTSLSGI
ncbi:hypothetical protein LTR62_008876 [Meristemomyces frigidus]|uniref:Uncharacterized protein n=1 Tax=Meristemomyces frigidus TaxID=1508187 RepID=A0AAN7YLL0_9PEZI|nr:hypothetical protein LTR62_008876 [Meristemomyces frigidus]